MSRRERFNIKSKSLKEAQQTIANAEHAYQHQRRQRQVGMKWMKEVIEEWKRLYWCGPSVRILNVVASPLLDILVCFLSRYSYLNLFILQKIYLIVPSDMFQCFKKPSFFFIVHFKNAHSSPSSIYPSCWCIESFPRSVVMLVRDVSSSILRDWKRSVLSWSPRSNRNGNVADRPEAK